MSRDHTPVSINDLRRMTSARVGLGRHGASLPTSSLLSFTLDHGRARDAVHAVFDVAALVSALKAKGCPAVEASSVIRSREEYLTRPDLGRRLDDESRTALSACEPCDVAIVIGDGLSPKAGMAHGVDVVTRLMPRLSTLGRVGPVVVARFARVALGDEIGQCLKARLVIVLIGERPGLSAPDSLGAYLTVDPSSDRTDADRNCVSNIHAAGLAYDEAAFKIAWLAGEAFARGYSGVALKDESGLAQLQRITTE